MSPWLRVLEAYLVDALLRTPAFHRGVEKVVKTVYRIRHGTPPEEMGGTKIDRPGESGFTKHFLEEIKTQIGYAEQKRTGNVAKNNSVNMHGQKTKEAEQRADDIWQNAQKNVGQQPKAGFMQEYIDALREQVKNNKSGK